MPIHHPWQIDTSLLLPIHFVPDRPCSFLHSFWIMLKLTYTDAGMFLELLTQSLEELVAQRLILAMRVREPLVVQPGYASLLLPKDLPQMTTLQALTYQLTDQISLCGCDSDYVEVALSGSWLASQLDADTGIFLVDLESYTERVLYNSWQSSMAVTPSLLS